jgi:hypothetical protein
MINKAFYREALLQAQQKIVQKKHDAFMSSIKYSIILQSARIDITKRQ